MNTLLTVAGPFQGYGMSISGMISTMAHGDSQIVTTKEKQGRPQVGLFRT